VVAGTRAPADLLGIRDEVGTVEVGKVADLIVLTADPLADPTAWRRVSWVVHDGVACSAVDPPRGRRLRSWGRMTLRSARATAARAP
jgi:cytosine/adenosine deaminase-related metal-dependent hydrolase